MRALLLALAACTSPGATFELHADPTLEVDLDRALVGWESIGIVRVLRDESPPIVVTRVPDDSIPADGVANRGARTIAVRESLTGFRLWVVLAHEVGHVTIDTPEHTGCGIMAGHDISPCAEDIALACTTLDLEVCP